MGRSGLLHAEPHQGVVRPHLGSGADAYAGQQIVVARHGDGGGCVRVNFFHPQDKKQHPLKSVKVVLNKIVDHRFLGCCFRK